jgi:hypothetical protein
MNIMNEYHETCLKIREKTNKTKQNKTNFWQKRDLNVRKAKRKEKNRRVEQVQMCNEILTRVLSDVGAYKDSMMLGSLASGD